MNGQLNPAIYGMTHWYSIALYQKFERLGYAKAKEIADAASELSLRTPLLNGGKDEFVLPYHDKKVSGGYVATAMSAFLVWTQKAAGNALPDSPLLKAAEDGYRLWKLDEWKGKSNEDVKG